MASTSYNQTPSASASTSSPTLWDVFLSFRGTDTRYTFTDHLYKALHRTGIRTFKDDPELRSGEIISDSLIQAIQESKTYIIVLSENYASSSWCLDELVEIVDCCKRMKRLVVPVFYNIDPSVVRHQVGSFKEAFEKHQTRFVMDKVSKWRSTLKEVADFSGYHISKNRSEADLIDEVVARVLVEINPTTLDVTKYPVGLDSRVKGVTTLFNSDTQGVIRIGIHGMGGVGKTTLAKAVYNQNYHRFQGSSFLSNVREVSRTEKGLVCLQQQLINDVLKRKDIKIDSVDQGIELIRARICSTKVLVVIDDLDDPKPLKYLEGSFALGSTVIITTRNEDLLDGMKVKAKYQVNQMDKDDSLQLFTQHAFGEDKMSEPFTELSKEILERAGGLPLALQVFGSTLLNQSEEGWRWFIDKLKQAPIDDVEENLMISFDALKSVDPNLQDIFLDIACFYIGWKKDKVIKILEVCYTFVNRKIDTLKKRCLITIDDDLDELGMHDLLQDMGRGIARNNSPDEPGKHSRLWDLADICSVLKKDKGTKAIKGIWADNQWYHWKRLKDAREVSFTAETFKRMSKLKFLYLRNVNITGSFEQTFEDLRWLCWENCPLECLPSGFYPKNLVKLELPRSEIKIMWELNMVSQVFGNLKTLKMSNSQNLTTTPDFTKLPCLETLDLYGCIRLEDVHVSIGSLVKLEEIDLGYCENLRNLPDSICNLRSLEILDVNRCGKLEELPDQVGMITSLRELNVKETSMLKVLPDISQLSKIECLDLRSCHHLLCIVELPPNLKWIEAGGCESLKRLPDLTNLKQLERLDLTHCHALTEIQGLRELTSLLYLHLSDCRSMERLPNLSNLKQLKNLILKGCSGLTEIQGLGELTSLEYLHLSDCRSMGRLPNLSNLKQLKKLILEGCSGLTEIQGSGELTSLTDIMLDGCRKLLSIAELPPNLKQINANDCGSMERLPNLSNLKQLDLLNLRGCSVLTEIQGLGGLTSLEYLNLGDCRSLERLPNLSNLKQLKKLILKGCSGLTEIQGSGELTSLIYIMLDGCRKLLSIAELPPNLKWIDACGCGSMERLPNLSNLNQLKELILRGCSGLTEIQGLGELTSLEYLHLGDCRSMERLPNLSNLKQLKELDLQRCSGLTEIQGLKRLTSLEYLDLGDCRSMKKLNLKGCSGLTEILGLGELTSLEYLSLGGCRSLERLPNLSDLKQLKELILGGCLTEIQGLEGLTSLRKLWFEGCNSSLVAYTLTERFFQIFSGFGHPIQIFLPIATEYRNWINESSECVSRMPLDLQPNASHNFLGIILVFKYSSRFNYSVKNITSGFVWRGHVLNTLDREKPPIKNIRSGIAWGGHVLNTLDREKPPIIVIVPTSIFSITNGDDRIELTSNVENIINIHLLYKTEINHDDKRA